MISKADRGLIYFTENVMVVVLVAPVAVCAVIVYVAEGEADVGLPEIIPVVLSKFNPLGK